MKQAPLVSIIIPTYKRASFLQKALNSVLMQTYKNIEVIVVDDNNPDSIDRKQTMEVISTYSVDKRVHYICHPFNMNGAAARNTGIAHSHGDYLCFLDDDDIYYPQKIKAELDFLLAHPEYDAVYCGYKRDKKIVLPTHQGDLTFELLSGIIIIYTNTIMIKKESAINCGGWDERFRRNQEAVFLLRYFDCGGKIGALPYALVNFDTSDPQNRSNPKQHEQDISFFLEKHQSNILRCTSIYSKAEKIIYSYRFRGVFLNYIKYKCFPDAFRLWFLMSRKMPYQFNHDIILYIKRRILKQSIFKEFEQGVPFDE